MHVLVTGAAGMIGRKFVERVARDGRIGKTPVERMTLTDVVAPTPPKAAFKMEVRADDIAASGVAEVLVKERPALILHLAAIVSGEAESDFEKGYRVNHDGTRQLLEAARKIGVGYNPRFVLASTIAVVSPRVTASRAEPAPTTPPPTTRMSTSSALIRAIASSRAAGDSSAVEPRSATTN